MFCVHSMHNIGNILLHILSQHPGVHVPTLVVAVISFSYSWLRELRAIMCVLHRPPATQATQIHASPFLRGPANAVRDTFALRYLSSYCEDKRRDMSRDVLLVMVSTGTITYTFRRKEAFLRSKQLRIEKTKSFDHGLFSRLLW